MRMQEWSPARRTIAAILLGCQVLNGCYSWHVQPAAPEEYIANHPGQQVKLSRNDGFDFVFDSAAIATDSIRGFVGTRTTMIPLAGTRQVAVSRFSAGTTIGLLAGVVGVLAVIGALAAASFTNSFKSFCLGAGGQCQ
ncbi:MAG: hypothetical protein ACREL5_03330 [Gemmatimonadales bacterium]